MLSLVLFSLLPVLFTALALAQDTDVEDEGEEVDSAVPVGADDDDEGGVEVSGTITTRNPFTLAIF